MCTRGGEVAPSEADSSASCDARGATGVSPPFAHNRSIHSNPVKPGAPNHEAAVARRAMDNLRGGGAALANAVFLWWVADLHGSAARCLSPMVLSVKNAHFLRKISQARLFDG